MAVLLFLLAFLTLRLGRGRVLGEVHHEPRPRLLLVPLESSEVGLIELIIGLGMLA